MENKQTISTSNTKLNPIDVLVFSLNKALEAKLTETLKKVLDWKRYTIYPISGEKLASDVWKGKAALLAVIGNVGKHAYVLKDYILKGGNVLALHSDLLTTIIPNSIEKSREEVALFTYSNWKSIEMKMQILNTDINSKLNDGIPDFKRKIEVLCVEETWNTPVLIKVYDSFHKGIALISQIYLEEELNSSDKINDETRLDILSTILKDELGLHVRSSQELIKYTAGYLFDKTENDLLHLVNSWSQDKHIKKIKNLTVQWCRKEETPIEDPSNEYLPIYFDEKPKNFSTEEYLANLDSRWLGKTVIFSEVLTSTMDILEDSLANGLAVIAGRQTAGKGRVGNTWITPLGQAAISVQIWRKIDKNLPLIQHIAALAAVLTLRRGVYKDLDIRIKWPNDIYYGRKVKIGGTVSNASCMCDDVIVNIGVGVNISNKMPTTCISSIIDEFNRERDMKLPLITIESFVAKYCSQFELLLDSITTEQGVQKLIETYYEYWLHSNEEVNVKTPTGVVHGRISGVDSVGWLRVQTATGEITVDHDGNSFDMINGLIARKN